MTAQKNIDKFQLQFWVALFSVSFVSSTLPGFGTELETFKRKKTQQTISIRAIRQIFGATIKPRNKKKTATNAILVLNDLVEWKEANIKDFDFD